MSTLTDELEGILDAELRREGSNIGEVHHPSIVYDVPGGPVHPADAILDRWLGRQRRQERLEWIANLDLEAWALSLAHDRLEYVEPE